MSTVDAARAAVLAGTAWERAMRLMLGDRQEVVDPAVVALSREPTDGERELVASAAITWDELAMAVACLTEASVPRVPLFEALAVQRSANSGQYPRRQRARVKRRRR